MNTRFNTLDSKLHQVHTSADHTTHIADLEGYATNHETRIADLEKQWAQLEINKSTKRELIDLKSPSRCSNIKITGLPEKAEKSNPTGTNNFPSGLKVDLAHRLGPQSSTACSHSMIAKIHHFPEEKT